MIDVTRYDRGPNHVMIAKQYDKSNPSCEWQYSATDATRIPDRYKCRER